MKNLEITSNQESLENSADVIIFKGEAFTYKNSGLTRRVFVNKDKTLVIKVPVEKQAQYWNDEEFEIWTDASEENRLQLAKTTKESNGYIVQEFLQTIDDSTTEEWLGRPMTMKEIRFSKSCRSDVGYDKDGNLKCYDLHEFKQY